MFNFKVKLTHQQSKMSGIHSNNKIAIVAQGGNNGGGHSGLSQQPTKKVMMLIHTMVLSRSAEQVSSVLIDVFSFVLAIWLKWPHNGHARDNCDGNFELNSIQWIWLILEE
jgi:hypothetical protein